MPRYIYTFFKEVNINISELNIEDFTSLRNFQNKLRDIGHFYTPYKSIEDLIRKLRNQLDMIIEEIY